MTPLLLAALLATATPAAESPASPASAQVKKVRKARAPNTLRRRTLRLTEESLESIPVIHTAPGIPTTLVFEQKVKEGGVLLADVKGRFYPPQVMDRAVLLVPRSAVSRTQPPSLSVTLEDGTLLPFQLQPARGDVDVQVDVVLELQRAQAPDSPHALRATLEETQAALDECQASAGAAGVAKLAALVLEEDMDKPQAFLVERRSVHHRDKQSRMLVSVQGVYRLFGLLYVRLRLQNRDGSKSWVMDRAEVKLEEGDSVQDVRVLRHLISASSLAPDEKGDVVVVMALPERKAGTEVTLSLFEKHGDRHIELSGVEL